MLLNSMPTIHESSVSAKEKRSMARAAELRIQLASFNHFYNQALQAPETASTLLPFKISKPLSTMVPELKQKILTTLRTHTFSPTPQSGNFSESTITSPMNPHLTRNTAE